MEQRKVEMDQQRWKKLLKCIEEDKGLKGALAGYAAYAYYGDSYGRLYRELNALYKKPLEELTAEEFLCRPMREAFAALAGRELAAELPALIDLWREGQFSASPWRRSYRSRDFGLYVPTVIELMCRMIRLSCYPEALEDRLLCTQLSGGGAYLLALEIRRGNRRIIDALHEAVMGDNSQILLTRPAIDAIILSGHEGLLEDLMRLLLAAQLQEGVRQQILEAADQGSAEVLQRILKICIDNDLFRFSAAVRAFDTWSGLGFGDSKAVQVRQCARIAYECLTDEGKRQAYALSENNLEVYFALWAQGCREFRDTAPAVDALLRDPRHYRRVLGWLFVSRTDNSRYQMAMATQHLEERDEELLAWITGNLARTWALQGSNWRISGKKCGQAVENPVLPADKAERRRIFDQLKVLGGVIGNKKRTFHGNPFAFVDVTLDSEKVYGCMLSLAGYDMDEDMVDELLALAPKMSVEQRQSLICLFLLPEQKENHRRYLQNALQDRSIMVKELAVERLGACRLNDGDVQSLAEALRSKSSDLRAAILTLLKKQPVALLRPLLPQMLSATEENQNQAAIELLMELKEQHPALLEEHGAALAALRERASTQTGILLDQLLPRVQEVAYTAENGFGLYDPAAVEDYAAGLSAPAPKSGLLRRFFRQTGALLSPRELRALFPTWEELDALLGRLDQVFVRHAHEEVEVEHFDGSRSKVLFGDRHQTMPLRAGCGCRHLNDEAARPEMVYFWEEFRQALGDYGRDARKMLGLYHLVNRTWTPSYYYKEPKPYLWYQPIAALELAPTLPDAACKKYGRIPQMLDLLQLLPKLLPAHEVFTEAMHIYRSIIAIWGEENLGREYMQEGEARFAVYGRRLPRAVAMNHRMLGTWREAIHRLELNAEDFAEWFTLQYRLDRQVRSVTQTKLHMKEYFRACHEGVIPPAVLLDYLLDRENATKIRVLTNPNRWAEGREIYEKYPFARELVARVVHRAVEVEEKRGELPTPMTQHCLAIERLEGAEHFCRLLAALGKESFFRGYEYSQNDTKKAVLSRLLKRCYPARDDTPAQLAALLRATDISDKRLAEAVMYAPQWAGFAEEILGWSGLKCGVWFFHAHINEQFSAEKETETAIYSPISPQQFNDGAFDKHWFYEAYEALGEKRFAVLYKSAKYITAGSNQHRRSQLYTDAVLGRLDAEGLMQEIREKRNQEKLRCYPLIPLAAGDQQEALRRYEFIQQFLKESKQFGAQRRDSEKKACATAMENLAITTGLMDVNRLMWQMESRKLQQLRPLMEPVEAEGVSFRLAIDENGAAAVVVEKGGKTLKTPPKSLAKREDYLERKAAAKELKELKRRARESMERAMTECTLFGAEELRQICGNPVLAPMVLRLLWTDGTVCGFLRQTEEGLTLVERDGTSVAAGTLRLAHPHDLRCSGAWREWMRLLYERKLVQPFKQVFREYYPLTDDERQERTVSRRYAGHQVQPRRTVALLKSRGWTVDYEEGLQKVFYKEDLIVRMYAMADWFSPAEIEAPTLETVEFFHRRTGQSVALEEVPPILFSETMRDLDLVVSVAHVGGVDPEASHSTVEMRLAIAAELVHLLRLENVAWVGSHARIRGKLGTYSVHMGSGVVHAEGVGMVAILPVHAQHRGRIFLPFADDDPKTAEILSKILLLSEDGKLKDPAILSQLGQ